MRGGKRKKDGKKRTEMVGKAKNGEKPGFSGFSRIFPIT